MKNILILLLLILTSCSPKLKSTISNKQNSLSINNTVLIIDEKDEREIKGIKVGEVSSKDNGFSTNCSYNVIIELLKDLTRKNGANILKITKHKKPDFYSSCVRIEADIYKVDDIREYEVEIEWNEYRKLTWADFKGTPKPFTNPNAEAVTYCGFSFQVSKSTIFHKTERIVTNTFDTNLSWVKPDQKNNKDLLIHEQGHFDISQIYARILEKELNNKITTVNQINSDAQKVYKKIYSQYLEKQELYEKETEYGTNIEQQKKWNEYIKNELKRLE